MFLIPIFFWWLTFASIYMSLATRMRINETRTLFYLNRKYATNLTHRDIT